MVLYAHRAIQVVCDGGFLRAVAVLCLELVVHTYQMRPLAFPRSLRAVDVPPLEVFMVRHCTALYCTVLDCIFTVRFVPLGCTALYSTAALPWNVLCDAELCVV
jgi:hypothetical protein